MTNEHPTLAEDAMLSASDTASCCSVERQATCCEPGEKPGCCDVDGTAGGGCGCR